VKHVKQVEEMGNVYRMRARKPQSRDCSGGTDVDARMLKWIIKKYGVE